MKNPFSTKKNQRIDDEAANLVQAFNLGIRYGKADEAVRILGELTAQGSTGDNFELPMKDFLAVFDQPAEEEKKS